MTYLNISWDKIVQNFLLKRRRKTELYQNKLDRKPCRKHGHKKEPFGNMHARSRCLFKSKMCWKSYTIQLWMSLFVYFLCMILLHFVINYFFLSEFATTKINNWQKTIEMKNAHNQQTIEQMNKQVWKREKVNETRQFLKRKKTVSHLSVHMEHRP